MMMLSELESLQAALLDRLGQAGPIRLDGSQVERCDAASIQLTVAIARQARSESRDFEVVKPSAALLEAVRLLRLDGELNLPCGDGGCTMTEVLIVDDSASMRGLVTSTLTQGGFQVTAAENGQDALGKANAHKYALVVTDVNMPIMDGLTLVGELRKLANYRFIPILVLTTEVDPAKKSRAKQAGATGWLVKPFDPRKFLDTVRKVLS